MNQEPPITPDFASWERETLNDFAAQAYLKLREQRELIQYLRQLITTPESNNGKPS